MEIGNVKSWKRTGKAFPKSGQGEARLVSREGDTNGMLYVLKTMPPAQASRPERQERFKREIEALRQFDDPHVLKIVDYGTDERGAPYLVTPYCENGSLENVSSGAVIDTLRRFHGICQGVAHAHAKNVVHRDIKPRNIFLDSKHEAVVGDFGLCFLMDDLSDDRERITETMEVGGSEHRKRAMVALRMSLLPETFIPWERYSTGCSPAGHSIGRIIARSAIG